MDIRFIKEAKKQIYYLEQLEQDLDFLHSVDSLKLTASHRGELINLNMSNYKLEFDEFKSAFKKHLETRIINTKKQLKEF